MFAIHKNGLCYKWHKWTVIKGEFYEEKLQENAYLGAKTSECYIQNRVKLIV